MSILGKAAEPVKRAPSSLQGIQNNKALQERHQDLVDSICPCGIGIRDFWQPVRKAASTCRREEDILARYSICKIDHPELVAAQETFSADKGQYLWAK